MGPADPARTTLGRLFGLEMGANVYRSCRGPEVRHVLTGEYREPYCGDHFILQKHQPRRDVMSPTNLSLIAPTVVCRS